MNPSQMLHVIDSMPASIRERILCFTVFGTPRPKQRARRSSLGFFYTPRETKKYEELVKTMAMFAAAKYRSDMGRPWDKDASYGFHAIGYFPDAHPRDVDNVNKSVMDGCQEILYSNDNRVKCSFIAHVERDKLPRIEIIVRKMTDFHELAQRVRRVFLMDGL